MNKSSLTILTVLLFMLTALTTTAQPAKKINPGASEKRGDLFATIQEFSNAETEYMDVLSSGSIDILTYDRVNIKLATALYNIRRYSESDKRFETVYVRNKNAFTPTFATAYVSTLIRLGKFKQAIEVAANFSSQPLYKHHKPLQNLRAGLEHQAQPPATLPYTVSIASFNKPGSNYATTQYSDGIIFVHHDNDEKSLIKGAQLYLYNGDDSKPYTKIPHTMQAGPAVFDKASNMMIYTDNRYLGKGFVRELKEQTLVTNQLRLVELSYNAKAGVWENPKDVFKDKIIFSTCHPSLSNDGKRMYFSANFTEGTGGMDLYMCNRVGKSWSKPVSLGKPVNTKDEEMYPYIYGDKLYFVSNGRDGLGGMDIYCVKVDPNGMPLPSTLEHLPYPINTIYNDYAFIYKTDEMGYFSSDRPEGQNLDTIYSWTDEEDIPPENSLIEKASVTAKPNQNAGDLPK